jgi:hypothetical protein
MTRQKYPVLLILAALSLFLNPPLVFSEPESPTTEAGTRTQSATIIPFKTIDYFLNEKANYDLSFLWFDIAAEGSFRFTREEGGYKAVLEAETKGFIGFLTSYRKHVYISHLVYMPEKGKLRTKVFERHVVIRDKKEATITQLDYDNHLMSWEDYKNDKLKEKKSQPIPEGMEYEDILSAFLNFGLGVYGPIEIGRKFSINTIPEKGQATIEVHIPPLEEAVKSQSMFGKDFRENLMFIKLKVPKEIFKSKTGEVSILIDERIMPLVGIVEDYIGFGDIRGNLREERGH